MKSIAARPPSYLECEPLSMVRRHLLIGWMAALVSVLVWIVGYEAWQAVLAMMVVRVMVRV